MKIFRRLSKNFKASVVLSVIFTLLFPFSLLAETQYKVPKNSLSYFMQNPTQSAALETNTDKETGAVIPPLDAVENSTVTPAPVDPAIAAPVNPVNPEPVQQAPATVEPVVMPVTNQTFTEAPSMETVVVKASEEIPAKPQSEAKMSTPEITASSPDAAEHAPIIAAATSGDEPAFSAVLARMQQNKAKRVAAAEKLGLVLPSQGGDMAAVSPSLSKIQQTIQTILTRHA